MTGGFDPDWGGGAVSASTLGPAGMAAMVMDGAKAMLPPVVAPNAVITQSQLAAFEAAHVPIRHLMSGHWNDRLNN